MQRLVLSPEAETRCFLSGGSLGVPASASLEKNASIFLEGFFFGALGQWFLWWEMFVFEMDLVQKGQGT